MKTKILLFNLLLLSVFSGFGQRSGDVTIYSNTGKKFFVVLNGIRQNTEAETNVNISGLTQEWYKCLIIAEDKSFTLEKNIGVKMDSVVTYQITGKKKKYKLRYYTEAAKGGIAPTEQVNVVYHPTDLPPNNGTTTQNNGQINSGGGGSNNGTMNGSTTITQTNSTHGSGQGAGQGTGQGGGQATGQGGGISIGINATENGGTVNSGGQNGTESVNINVTINGTGIPTGNGTGINSSYEETVTTTSSSTTINGVTSTSEETTITTNVNGMGSTTANTTGGISNTDPNISMNESYPMLDFSDGNCVASQVEMETYKAAISNESFSEGQQNLADQVALNTCLTVAQIREITELFAFSENKIIFLKAAYINCLNQADYFQLMSALTFSEDKEALEEFIQSHQ